MNPKKSKSSTRFRTFLSLVLLTLICCGTSGCDITLGPKVKTVYVLVRPGKPLQILENVQARGRLLGDDGGTVEQDIGGWVAMPQEHWEAIKRTLKGEGD